MEWGIGAGRSRWREKKGRRKGEGERGGEGWRGRQIDRQTKCKCWIKLGGKERREGKRGGREKGKE